MWGNFLYPIFSLINKNSFLTKLSWFYIRNYVSLGRFAFIIPPILLNSLLSILINLLRIYKIFRNIRVISPIPFSYIKWLLSTTIYDSKGTFHFLKDFKLTKLLLTNIYIHVHSFRDDSWGKWHLVMGDKSSIQQLNIGRYTLID